MKKYLSAIFALIIAVSCCSLCLSAYAGVKLDTEVPTSHTITVNGGSNGSTTINDNQANTGEPISVGRGEDVDIVLKPDPGYIIGSVTVNGDDVTSLIVNGELVLRQLNEDSVINISYSPIAQDDDATSAKSQKSTTVKAKVTAKAQSTAKRDTKKTSPDTGASTMALPIIALSAGLAVALFTNTKKSKV